MVNVKRVHAGILGRTVTIIANTKESREEVKEEVKEVEQPIKTFESETKRLAQKYGVSETLALKIMYCESRHYTRRENKNYNKKGEWWSSDWGRWQINDYWHEKDALRKGYNIYNEWDNLEYGFILLSRDGTRHWNASKPCWGQNLTLNELKLKYK